MNERDREPPHRCDSRPVAFERAQEIAGAASRVRSMRLRRAATRDLRVVAADASTSGTARRETRPAACTADTRAARLRAVRLLVGRVLVAEHARQEAHAGLDDRHRRDLAAGHHEVAERDLLVDEARGRARRSPRSGRRSSMTRGAPRARAPCADRTACPCGVSSTRCARAARLGASASSASMQATITSTRITMPLPPPYGVSSTLWCLPSPKSRGDCDAHHELPAGDRARRRSSSRGTPSNSSGNSVTTSTRTAALAASTSSGFDLSSLHALHRRERDELAPSYVDACRRTLDERHLQVDLAVGRVDDRGRRCSGTSRVASTRPSSRRSVALVDDDARADEVARVELALFERREIPAPDADVRAAKLLGAIAVVDGVELHEDRVVGAARAVDGTSCSSPSGKRTSTSSCSRRRSLSRCRGGAQLAAHAVRARDLGERHPVVGAARHERQRGLSRRCRGARGARAWSTRRRGSCASTARCGPLCR